MKRFYLLLAVLLSFAGMQTVRAQKFEAEKGELYVIRDLSWRYLVDNPDHQCSLAPGHPDLLNLNYDDGNYHGLYYIEGDSVSGYTIRPASRPDCYVYAVCNNYGVPVTSSYAGMGVKEVSGEPGDECIWYITCPPGWANYRMSPKLNPNVFVSTSYSSKTHDLGHPVFRTSEIYLFFVPLVKEKKSDLYSSSSYAEVVDAGVEMLKQQGVNADTWAAFLKATDEVLDREMPGGWCRIKSLAPVEDDEPGAISLPYLYSNTRITEDGFFYPALCNRRMTPQDGNYIWRVSPYLRSNGWDATLWGNTGRGLNYVGRESETFNNIALFRHSNPVCYDISCWVGSNSIAAVTMMYGESGKGQVFDTDWALVLGGGSYSPGTNHLFVFERVEEADLPGTPYMVSVSAPKSMRDLAWVEYVGSEDFVGNHSVSDGGFFFLKSAPTAADFRVNELAGYRSGIVVSDGHITVTYDKNDFTGRFYSIGRRAETLESGKLYAIFNTASSMDIAKERMALLYNKKTGTQMLCEDLVPHQGAVIPATYAWRLTQGSAPDLWVIESVIKDKFVGWSEDNVNTYKLKSEEMRIVEWTAANPEWREINVKSLNDDGSFTTNSRISEANHVWVIGRKDNTLFWNGENTTTFATWAKSHPFAFYELTEVDFPDGIAGVEAADPRPATGTYDLQGRRVQQARKGIYIRDGKKIVVK